MDASGITGLVLQEAYTRIKDNSVVLYPMGDNGFIVKNFLNSILNIQETAIIDRNLSKYLSTIFSIREINQITNYKDCVFLITSNKECFSRFLIEQGISPANIINPWMSRNELLMSCFIYIICNEDFIKILDYGAFLYDFGQFTKSFYSSLEDKFYLFNDKQFFTNNSTDKLPGFRNLYSHSEEVDVCIIVIQKSMVKKQIESIIAEQLKQEYPLFCISEDILDCNIKTPDKIYRFSRLYVYHWEVKE